MQGRALVASILFLGAAFAGCISRDDAPAEELVPTNETGTGFADETDKVAPDGRGELSAFKESNRTETNGTGSMDHMHDYWQGQTRLDVAYLDSGLIPFPLLPCKEAGTCTLGGGGETYPPGTAIADYDVPKPGLVYEGTDHLEILLVYKCLPRAGVDGEPCTDHPQVHPMIDYLTAADEPGQFRTGGELTLGTPMIIPVKPTEADMPHQTKSLWIFRVYTQEPTWFEWNITITAVKGNAVVNWPPHPDLYADKSERLVFQGPVHMESKGTIDSNIYGSDAGWVNPERILSWGTQRIEIEVKNPIFSADTPIPPAGYVLEYHNASKPPLLGNGAQYGDRLVSEDTDGSTVWRYTIDITNDHDSYDTPYGEKSRWGFRFVPQFDNGGAACVDDRFLQQLLVGCQVVPWKLDYEMTIKAFGESHVGTIPDEREA